MRGFGSSTSSFPSGPIRVFITMCTSRGCRFRRHDAGEEAKVTPRPFRCTRGEDRMLGTNWKKPRLRRKSVVYTAAEEVTRGEDISWYDHCIKNNEVS